MLDMAAGFPDARVRDDRALDAHDIIAHLHHKLPPVAAQVGAHLHAQRAKVIEARHAAVNL